MRERESERERAHLLKGVLPGSTSLPLESLASPRPRLLLRLRSLSRHNPDPRGDGEEELLLLVLLDVSCRVLRSLGISIVVGGCRG